MREDTVVQLRQPGTFSEDPLTEILRLGARRLLAQAVEMEVTTFVEGHADLTDGEAVDRRSSGPSVRPNGRRRMVRHGYLPEREIQTGIGPVAVRCPRVRDRGAGETGPRIRFTSRILPPYLRRAKSIEELLPWLYLKGCPRAISPRRLRRCWGRRRRGSRPRPLSASRRSGKARWSIGNGAISRPGVTSTSGPTASTSHHGSITTSNASWSSWAPMSWAARSC